MNNKEVAHLWANQSRERATGSHFYFEGDTIYSYGSHFPIARHYKGAVLFTAQGSSVTTARHKSYVRSACTHKTVFTVAQPLREPCGEDVKNYGEQIKYLAIKAAKARNPEYALQILETEVSEANQFCERFSFKTRFTMPDNLDELKAKAKASAERERKAKTAKQARLEREAQETISKWLAGESVSIPHFIGKVYLRRKPDNYFIQSMADGQPRDCDGGLVGELETSKGARVPLSEAERTFKFCMAVRERGWHRNGDQHKVGDYQLDAVNEAGVVAGCHRIGWDEIERFAAAQGWIA